jgi:hypothetical protein
VHDALPFTDGDVTGPKNNEICGFPESPVHAPGNEHVISKGSTPNSDREINRIRSPDQRIRALGTAEKQRIPALW